MTSFKEAILFVGGIFILALVLMHFSGSSELPPEPPEVGEALNEGILSVGLAYSSYISLGWAPPYDVFNNEEQIVRVLPRVVEVEADITDFELNVSVNHDGAFIYKYGYYHTPQGWVQFTFSDETYEGSNWILDDASTELSLSSSQFNEGNNFVVAYSCKKYEGEWKCGCADENVCGRWMLEDYLMTINELPPEPSEPGEVSLGEISLGFNPNLVLPSEETQISAYVNTLRSVGQLQNPEFVLTNLDTGEKTIIDAGEASRDCSPYGDSCTYFYLGNFSSLEDFSRIKLNFSADNLPSVYIHPSILYVDSELMNKFVLGNVSGWHLSSRGTYEGYLYGVYRQELDYYQRIELGLYLNASEFFLEEVREEVHYESDLEEISNVNFSGSLIQRIKLADTPDEGVHYIWMSDSDLIILGGINEDEESFWEDLLLVFLEKHPARELFLPLVCDPSLNPSCLDLSEYPNMFVSNELDPPLVLGSVILGDDATSSDTLAGVDIVTGIRLYYGSENASPVVKFPYQYANLAQDVELSEGPGIVISTGCVNAHAQTLFSAWGYDCATLEEGNIVLGTYQGNTFLVVHGQTEDDTRRAALILANLESYPLSGTCARIIGDDFENIDVDTC